MDLNPPEKTSVFSTSTGRFWAKHEINLLHQRYGETIALSNMIRANIITVTMKDYQEMDAVLFDKIQTVILALQKKSDASAE